MRAGVRSSNRSEFGSDGLDPNGSPPDSNATSWQVPLAAPSILVCVIGLMLSVYGSFTVYGWFTVLRRENSKFAATPMSDLSWATFDYGSLMVMLGGLLVSVIVVAYSRISSRNAQRLHRSNQRLDQVNRALDVANERLLAQNARFATALNNMSQGLCFFDGAQRLIVCNSRYIEMYDLPPDRVRPGISLGEIVDLRFAAGSCPTMSREEYLVWRNSIAISDNPCDTIVELKNGRTFPDLSSANAG